MAMLDEEDDPVLHLIPADQLDRVLRSDCDIDGSFLGFTQIYISLASVIPRHWTIVDLGCAYAPQAFVFQDHAAYVGVDFGTHERFIAGNTKHYSMTIADFISKHLGDFDLDTTFAICSYVPPWHNDNIALARHSFKNVFTYYPAKTPGFPFIAFKEH
ncbi:hypothetical protein HLI01_22095 [Rhizobium laguerreae]|uniref:hypothetical protein n=1 Tax=Rhizobium laguerreae TaxID=1076926 RepID=UPI00147916E3|nr:hypothetical protein [Rhizobium laguerreae]NNH59429.1 hypothetical protein [Rhizobium laguerreae]